jgi:orotidine-5'-phosphate decarboxylase
MAPAARELSGLCVALDFADPERCRSVARAVAPHAGMLKLGLTSFTGGGSELAREVAGLAPLFLDLKLHDIPSQVAGAVAAARALGARCTTVHAAGGAAMVEAAAGAAGDDVVVLAVTVLTSLDGPALRSTGVADGPQRQALRLSELALRAGARGLVCSPHEARGLRARFGARGAGGPLLVVPGARATGAPTDDQARVASPEKAVEAGADVVVVGRPVTTSSDPAAAAASLGARLAGAGRAAAGKAT